MQHKRDELAAQARPPQAVLDVAAVNPETVKLGAELNKTYTAALRMGKKRATLTSLEPVPSMSRGQALSKVEGDKHTNALERAKAAAEDYLAHFPPERRGMILLGALASVYGKEKGGSDTAVWLAGDMGQPEQLQPGTGHLTIEALRGIGLLDDIIMTKEGLVVYPTGLDAEDGN
jgi:hypothetical protein